MLKRDIAKMNASETLGVGKLKNIDVQARSVFYDTTYYRNEMYYISYRAGKEGIWRSSDYGNTWKHVLHLDGVQGIDYRGLWKNKNGLGFIWTAGGNLVRTTPNLTPAESFTDMYHPLSITNGIDEDPSKNLIMYAEYGGTTGINGKRIWKSTDNGASWQVAHEDQTIGHWHTCQRDPYTGYWYATSGDSGYGIKVIQSKDDGVTWQTLAENSQEYRLCGFGFTEEYIIWATDYSGAPAGTINLWKINKVDIEKSWDTVRINVSNSIEGPAYGMIKTVEGRFMFWAAAENREMSKLYLTDGVNVKEILSTNRYPNTSTLLAGFSGATKPDNNNRILLTTDSCEFGNGVYLFNIPIGLDLSK